MIRRLLAQDGVEVVCHFRDDGTLTEGYGRMERSDMGKLAQFAHDYRRMIQGNADQLSVFTGMRGWTPPRAWVLRGEKQTLCGVANFVCVVNNHEGSLQDIMKELDEVSHW